MYLLWDSGWTMYFFYFTIKPDRLVCQQIYRIRIVSQILLYSSTFIMTPVHRNVCRMFAMQSVFTGILRQLNIRNSHSCTLHTYTLHIHTLLADKFIEHVPSDTPLLLDEM